MANFYPEGQCTWGAVEMCPCLGDLATYGDFGNGGDWYSHAQQIGLPTSKSPQTGWLASFNVLPPYGDVGLIIGINGDGTVTRYGVNWHLNGSWSVDNVPSKLVKGCFKPPCACTGPSGRMIEAQLLSAQAKCQTFSWNLLGGQVCFDGFIAALAMVGGTAMLIAGAIILVVWASRTQGGKATIRSAEVTGGTAQAAVQTVRRSPTGRRTAAETAASRQRVATSRARAATRTRQPRRGTPVRAVSRQEATEALRSGRTLTTEEARALGATEVPK